MHKIDLLSYYLLGEVMLKRCIIRKIFIYVVAFIIIGILYFFPSENLQSKVEVTTNIVNPNTSPIFLLNKDNYVVRTSLIVKESEPLKKVEELIQALTIGSDKLEYLPTNFKPIIPKNTRILSLDLNNGLLKINFSKEFLEVNKELEEALIESVVYTLTNIKEVNDIMIFIDGEKLEMLPKTKIRLPNTLNRDFGINKVYDITSIKDSSKTTIYYIGKEDNITYYIPITKVDNNKKDKIEVIIEELKSSPTYDANLMSYLRSSVELLNYEVLEQEIALSFNEAIFNDLNERNILEEVKYSIALSLKDTCHVANIIFKVDDEVITTFLEN